uniref:Uncharacterized protein n=1 Tax=Peronospora matthiolae TaxID=2874970 RepID=A0AAV1T7X2_9STRA
MDKKPEFRNAFPAQSRRCRLTLMIKMLLGLVGAGIALLLLNVSMLNKNSIVPVEYLNAKMDEGADFYPDEILDSELGDDVGSAVDLLHLSFLQEACLNIKGECRDVEIRTRRRAVKRESWHYKQGR